MAGALKLLLIEDSADDEALLLRNLKKAGHEIEYHRVEDTASLIESLESQQWDLVISDHVLPTMNSEDGLEIVRRYDPDLPFIVVSGRIGEDSAVRLMKAGANDYVMKGNLARLPAAIDREIREGESRRQRRIADERYRGLIEETSDLVQQVGLDDRIVYVNPAWLETLGYTLDEAVGTDIWSIIHQDSFEHCRVVFAKAFANSDPQSVSAVFVTKGGKRIDVEGTVRQRDDGKGTITTDAFFRNISARSELQRMKDELVNLIAHELRTPLTPISTVLELLSDSEFTVTPERMRGLLKTAHRNTEWLVRLIDQIVELQALNSGERELKVADSTCHSLLLGAANRVQPLADERHVTISIECDEMTVSVDSNLVTTALINVLENSVKVTPEGGDVRLSALATQEELVIQVSDGGPGIPQEDLSKIFDSFYQLDRYGGSKAGLGIGLAIARRVVQTHGGTIWANSGPDGGTVVTITLPR